MLLILRVEVEVPARRRGHGRALVDEALDLARVRGDIEVVAPAGPGDPGASRCSRDPAPGRRS